MYSKKNVNHLYLIRLVVLKRTVAAVSRFLSLWFAKSCTIMSMIGIAMHFLGIFAMYRFAFVI